MPDEIVTEDQLEDVISPVRPREKRQRLKQPVFSVSPQAVNGDPTQREQFDSYLTAAPVGNSTPGILAPATGTEPGPKGKVLQLKKVSKKSPITTGKSPLSKVNDPVIYTQRIER